MAIVILGLDKPKNCMVCRIGHKYTHDDGTVWCNIAKDYVYSKYTKCPIVQIPVKEGVGKHEK